ncbi:MAG TPA: hypothetical protein VMR18_00485 [Candidatus Saccharimonadales bacterium]|jgi:hypothetical protein|nr:hypothetical protein [Candidatus Saccharimonadales bacterium]
MDNQPQQLPTSPLDSSDAGSISPQSAPQQNPQQNPAFQAPNAGYQPLQAPNQSAPPNTSSPGLIVLQWLTYAFWGWTVLAMSVLTATVLANFIAGANDGNFMPYTIAATLVLLPISVVCDFFYSKQEPEKKTGAASIVMVIHAVIFALFGIGALITIVVCLVQLFTSSSTSNYTHVALCSAMIITLLYAAVFLRTLNISSKLKWFHRFFIGAMIVVVGIFSVLGIVGPAANARLTRNDSLIDSNLSTIQSSIDNYASTNNNLPTSLNSIGLSGDAQKLVTDNLVQYTPNIKPSTTLSSNDTTQPTTTYYYELCVNYKKSSSSDGGSPYSSSTAENNYSNSVNTYDHPAGNYCYKVSSTTN